jgi:hypothetical protein
VSDAIGKAARNERLKLRAASANAVGLAFGAIGFIQPVVTSNLTFVAVAKLAICAAIAYIFHNYAMQVLARLED